MASNYIAMIEALTLAHPLCGQDDHERDIRATRLWAGTRDYVHNPYAGMPARLECFDIDLADDEVE